MCIASTNSYSSHNEFKKNSGKFYELWFVNFNVRNRKIFVIASCQVKSMHQTFKHHHIHHIHLIPWGNINVECRYVKKFLRWLVCKFLLNIYNESESNQINNFFLKKASYYII